MKKHFVFDDEGKLIEVRGYRDDDVVVERWEIVYDESERVVGLRPLSPEDVIPQSILDRMKFWRKPKPLTQILSIDFIGLIQYIGMIYKIKKVVTIEQILEILNIKNIESANVKTVGLDNILIDKLKVGAYTERRSTLSNNGETPSTYIKSTEPRRLGKYFPRGCRGFIRNIGVYCKDAGTSGGTVTVYIAPTIGMGEVASKVITVPSSGSPTWRIAVFNMMWNYDSLFIWVLTSSADIQVGYDAGTPYDSHRSDDSGASWYFCEYRLWFNSYIVGETCGDVPVSGTINTVEIPTSSSVADKGLVLIGTGDTETVATFNGAGHLLRALLYTAHDDMTIEVHSDGTKILTFSVSVHNSYGYGATTPGIQILKFVEAGDCYIQILIQYPFKRKLEVKVYNYSGENKNARCWAEGVMIT